MNNFDAPFASPLVHYTGMATFLLGALSLTVPSGYSIGAALLLLGSIMLVRKHPFIKLESKDIWLIVVMAIFSFVGMGDAWWGGGTIREIDKPSRFLLAIPAMLLVLVYPPRPAWLWAGLALGAFGAGVLAGWQFFIEGMQRTGGMTQTIQFGNIALLLGMLCLAGIRWAWSQSCRACWLMLLTMGTLGGLSASLLSGSRGGWIALPPILFTLYIAYSQVLKLRWKVSFTLLFFLIGTLIYPESVMPASTLSLSPSASIF